MKPEAIVLPMQRREMAAAAVMLAAASAAFLFFASRQVIWDIGWLIEGSRRWMAGAVLYRDIIEVNPPLIFYETVALSGGILTQSAYVAGVCIAIFISGLWSLRLRGPYVAISAVAAMILAGLHDFGQRDHLALIFGMPFLLRGRHSRAEGVLLGMWSFFGFGLKPYLLLMPLADGAARAWLARSFRPLFTAPYMTLAVLGCGYMALIAAVHPLYLTQMIPLGRFVYWAYSTRFAPDLAILSAVILVLCAAVLLSGKREIFPLVAAMVAALAGFYLQGRYWTYHFVPALGLAMVVALIQAQKDRRFALLAALLIAGQLERGLSPRNETPIPAGVKSVAILSDQVGAAYPTVIERGIRNDTRYPALWTLPGAWSIANDPNRSPADRAKAKGILASERTIIRGDILQGRPEVIMAATRGAHFDRPFDYMRFLGPFPGYQFSGRAGRYEIYSRRRY